VVDLGNLVRLQQSQAKSAGEMLTRAFQDNPLLSYFIPNAIQRGNKLPCMFEFMVRLGISCGEAYVTSSNLEGVAIWLPPGVNMTLWRMIRSGGLSLFFKLGMKSVLREWSADQFFASMRKRHTPFPHWYLALLGVEPKFQGKGYASRLLEPMLTRLDERHLPCFLETENERNVAIYQHYGFEVVEKATIPGAGLTSWAMLRQAPG